MEMSTKGFWSLCSKFFLPIKTDRRNLFVQLKCMQPDQLELETN